jgi:hypothetical protein
VSARAPTRSFVPTQPCPLTAHPASPTRPLCSYQFVQDWNPAQGIVPNSGQLWRWTPGPPAGRGGGGSSSSGFGGLNDPIVVGHTAGIVLGLLLGMSNLYVLYRIAQNSGIDLTGLGGAGGRKSSGFYAGAALGPADIAGAYEAPSA